MKLLKLLYELGDARDYWQNTVVQHINNNLGMVPTAGELYRFLKATEGALRVINAIYVDEKIGTGDENFCEENRLRQKVFNCEPCVCDSFDFARAQIWKQGNGNHIVSQEGYAERLKILPRDASFEDFRRMRH